MAETDGELVDRFAKRHSVSPGAVQVVMTALRRGGGQMAQFSHAEFGGMSQWSSGMSMVGDMFNTQLKSKLDALFSDIARQAIIRCRAWTSTNTCPPYGGKIPAIWPSTVSAGHTEQNVTLHEVASYKSIPGHPRWGVAPLSMTWEHKSLGEFAASSRTST
jgi:hypothetical protein